MVTVSLPELPKGKEFEEYISACFQLGGYYIERNIIERDIEEILELDIILTNYGTTAPEITLVEVKSGEWGFADLFKVKGWMHYLNIPKGMFITNRQRSNIDFVKEKASGLDINLLFVPSLRSNKEVLVSILPECEEKDTTNIDIAIWRFSNWIERKLLQRLVHKRKSHQEMACYKALVDYYYQTSSGIFFTENIIKRVDKLYSIFRDSPHITAKTGHELLGEDFEDDYRTLPKKIFTDTFMECKYNDIQISMFLEHRARLAILKSAVDFVLYKNAGIGRKTDDMLMKILGIEFSLIDSLPSSFRQGLDTISKHKYFHRYPVFWQWFMWVFGGFILKDYQEKEYATLAEKTGIPIEEIPNAFESYEILFPLNDGWFTDFSPNSQTVVMKMFPVPFMGVGANYRRALYLETNEQGFYDLQLTGRWTSNDLIKSNNLVVAVLSEEQP